MVLRWGEEEIVLLELASRWEFLREDGKTYVEIPFDEFVREVGLPYDRVMDILTNLEYDGIIKLVKNASSDTYEKIIINKDVINKIIHYLFVRYIKLLFSKE